MPSHGTDRPQMTLEQQAEIIATIAHAAPKFNIGEQGVRLIAGDKGAYQSAVIAATRKHVSVMRQKEDDNKWDKFYSKNFGLTLHSSDRFQPIEEADPNTFDWRVLVRPEISITALLEKGGRLPSFPFEVSAQHWHRAQSLNHFRDPALTYSVLLYGHGNYHRQMVQGALLRGKMKQIAINLQEAVLLMLHLHESKRSESRETRDISLEESLPKFMHKSILCLGSEIYNSHPAFKIDGNQIMLYYVEQSDFKKDPGAYTILVATPSPST